jgi:hypothetical protein
MTPRDVPEIREAIALFESWERAVNDVRASKKFTEAMELLNDYLECEPESPHRQFVENLKIANTRSLLRKLAKVDKKDFELWLEYVLALAVTVESEAKALMRIDEGLKRDYDSFMGVWRDVLSDALARDKNRDQHP